MDGIWTVTTKEKEEAALEKRAEMEIGMRHFEKILGITLAAAVLTGCGAKENQATEVKLNPDKPVSLTIWHYYNGAQQATFDSLVEEFNTTVGKEEGIYVEGYSQGSVSDLEKAVISAMKGAVGAGSLPDIFSSYADTAYSVLQNGQIADLSPYFSEEELAEYVDSYIQEGYFNEDGALYLIPVAKSTEIMMINKTDWEPFAEACGVTLDEFATIEGVVRVAGEYYDWTDSLTPDVPDDGKAFYGRDSMSNYFIIGMKQMGQEIFEAKEGKVELHTDKELIRRLWDNYYVPYMKGYFAAYGKFRSDDVKTGDILAYTGATSSSLYFPDVVEGDNSSYPIDYIVLNAPVMEGGENYKVQQGAGMAVTKSDKEHEYAACVFLKWFTQKEQNLRFVCDSGYMPVKKDSNNIETLDLLIAEKSLTIDDKTYACLKTVLPDFDKTSYYTTKNFENGYATRKILDYNLSDRAAADKEALEAAVAAGASRKEELAKYLSEESFENWYAEFCGALQDASEGK